MENRINDILDRLKNDELNRKKIYKYHRINKFLYDLLINNEIWCASPYTFNDPFDCNLTIDGNNTADQIRKYFKVANWNNSKDNDEDIQRLINTDFQDKEAFQKKINSISRKIIQNMGLACFTQTKDNLLMWAHYTEDHKGICLEFDHTKDLEFFRPLKKVIYDQKYPIYNYYDDKKNVVGQLMLHKSKHWKYERELRLIKMTTGLYRFDPGSLTAIYFGVRTPDEQIKTIKNLVHGQEKYKNVKLFKGTIDTKDYKLIFEQIKE
ncbi:DUF2971 domain-containing protein [Elizabethkingia anophelis]|uniref:DUF2971 domain-containing protein n=1 Tax=Elizabethkingia anophelis TaxID=1117645 RepID=UPI0038919A92